MEMALYSTIPTICNKTMESRVINTLASCRPNEWFYPPAGANRIVCKMHTKIPHRNECGPQAILHGIILVLHPSPTDAMLESLKHKDLSLISRDIMAKLIIAKICKVYFPALPIEGNNRIQEEEVNVIEMETKLELPPQNRPHSKSNSRDDVVGLKWVVVESRT